MSYYYDPLYAWYTRPRIGQRFSLLPGPFPRPQKRWKAFLPWQVWVEMTEAGEIGLRQALGLQDDSEPCRKQWDYFIGELSSGRLLVRVIRLADYRIPPGTTRTQRQGRLDRWLPPGWKGDGRNLRLKWTKTTRFAYPRRSYSIRPREVRLVVEPVSFDEMMSALAADGGVARWLDDGQFFVFAKRDAPPRK